MFLLQDLILLNMYGKMLTGKPEPFMHKYQDLPQKDLMIKNTVVNIKLI